MESDTPHSVPVHPKPRNRRGPAGVELYVRPNFLLVPLALALLLTGCGPGGPLPGQVAGVVTDSNGGVVRGAAVTWGSRSTTSNASGAFLLENVSEGDQLIRAQITQDGLRYTGQNVVQVFTQERSKSLNIVVIRDNQQAGIRGTVRDRGGLLLSGAKVFALGNALSSSIALTDANGVYELNGLQAGIDYEVTGSARGYNSDATTVNLSVGESRQTNFTLDDGTNPALPVPQNLSATIWTSPREVSRSPSDRAALDAVKSLFDPRRPRATTRASNGGNHIETDLYWDPVSSSSLLGFGIYRGTSFSGAVAPIDFLRDPNAAFFADLDEQMVEGPAYYYEVTSLGTLYPDFVGTESSPSNRYGVTALGDLVLQNTSGSTRFHWSAANGATSYVVFVFDRYPGLDVDSIWSNVSTRTTNTFVDYAGPSLTFGRRYYYVVLGLANGDDSRTISRVGEFIAN